MSVKSTYTGLLLALLCSALLTVSGCGYRFVADAPGRLQPGQPLWVDFITNETVSPSAQTVVRRTLQDELHASRGLVSATDPAHAESRIKGRILSYSRRALSYGSDDRAREYRLGIEVELELWKRDTPAPVWKGVLQSTADYPANNNLSLMGNAEETALQAAARTIAQKLLTAVEQSF